MKKYILPIVNGFIICSLALILNFRDDTPVIGVAFAIIMLAVTAYLIKLIRNNGNEIKITAINKILTLASAALIAGCLYELVTDNTISDETGDHMAIILIAIGVGIWIYDYYIKPYKNNKL